MPLSTTKPRESGAFLFARREPRIYLRRCSHSYGIQRQTITDAQYTRLPYHPRPPVPRDSCRPPLRRTSPLCFGAAHSEKRLPLMSGYHHHPVARCHRVESACVLAVAPPDPFHTRRSRWPILELDEHAFAPSMPDCRSISNLSQCLNFGAFREEEQRKSVDLPAAFPRKWRSVARAAHLLAGR